MQYPWGYTLPVSHIISTRESYPQYPWRYAVPVRIWLTGTDDMTHGYCISLWVLRIWLTGTAYPHRYWGYDSWVLRIWLTGTEDMTYRYWGYDSRVMHILTGTAYSLHRVMICEWNGTTRLDKSQKKRRNSNEAYLAWKGVCLRFYQGFLVGGRRS